MTTQEKLSAMLSAVAQKSAVRGDVLTPPGFTKAEDPAWARAIDDSFRRYSEGRWGLDGYPAIVVRTTAVPYRRYPVE
jgi:hypothetical protein